VRTAGLVLCGGFAFFSTDLTAEDSYTTEVESVEGQKLLSKSFPNGTTALTDIVVPQPSEVPAVRESVAAVSGVEAVSGPVEQGAPGTLVQATLGIEPYSTEAFDLVCRTSMNLNFNPRLEDVELKDDPELYAFLAKILDEIFARHDKKAQRHKTEKELRAEFQQLEL